jgi:hypothetical protein
MLKMKEVPSIYLIFCRRGRRTVIGKMSELRNISFLRELDHHIPIWDAYIFGHWVPQYLETGFLQSLLSVLVAQLETL